ncbi:hypothetical protein PFISCL1PPCAC_9249, partial [Pristionchus fissidentatus]
DLLSLPEKAGEDAATPCIHLNSDSLCGFPLNVREENRGGAANQVGLLATASLLLQLRPPSHHSQPRPVLLLLQPSRASSDRGPSTLHCSKLSQQSGRVRVWASWRGGSGTAAVDPINNPRSLPVLRFDSVS